VRHDPSGSVVTLRWGDGTTAASHLPVEVAEGDVLVLFTESPASAGEPAPTSSADHVLAS